VCNLYSLASSQDDIGDLFHFTRDSAGNLGPMPAIFPDTLAPVVRTTSDGGRELAMMRWGFPPPPNLGTRPVSNVRNVKSPYLRNWLKPDFRCLMPVTSFCEWTDARPKMPHWFALAPTRQPFAFAGIWRPRAGERKGEAGGHRLFSFLATEAKDLVRPVHVKVMP